VRFDISVIKELIELIDWMQSNRIDLNKFDNVILAL